MANFHSPSAIQPHVGLRWLAGCLLATAALGPLWAQNRAGQVMAVTGAVTAVDAQGVQRALEKGGDIRPGDKIVTGEGALVQMRMNDGGYISVRSTTEMAIERFVYDDKEAGNSSMLVSLIRGGFRSITGLIGRTNPGAYAIRSATATVGIRGTDHEPMVILPGNAQGAAPGLYDKVNEGETFIRTERGLLALTRGQVGFAPVVADRPPQALRVVPDFYKIEVKTDARDPKDATTTSRATDGDKGDTGGLLRPSTAARREALKETTDGKAATTGATGVTGATSSLRTGTATVVDTGLTSTSATTLKAPLSTTVIESATVLTAPAATSVSPTTSLTTSTSLTAPLTSATTLVAPAATSTTLIAPTTTLVSPTTTLVAPTTTLVAPITTTTLIVPTTTLIAPVTTTTTLIAPTTTTVSPTLTAPKTTTLIVPTTTIKSTLIK